MSDIAKIIEDRIDSLRPKLLDLGRRNPLISTTFSERSHSLIRAVDELPDFLHGMLSSKQKMDFAPLPPLDEDPKDEDTREFQSLVADARLTDELYINALDAGEGDFSGSAERLAKAERDLKDRIREQLGMPPRQTQSNLSIRQHAINNNISPEYELPLPDEHNDDGRHDDDLIQSLLLPEALVRRLNNIMTKYRTWIQETGINVLHTVFGFLEWRDDHSDKASFAPLILLSVDIEKKRTSEGFIFSIRSVGDAPERNEVLAEKLLIEFGIKLPELKESETPESYFSSVKRNLPPGRNWKVRRQVATGVFPSARIAMYHDLESSNWNFADNPIISDLVGGVESSEGISFYGDEYEVDAPEIESKVPVIIADIDSSQFSALVDVANGKNLAVEGPPGSGKSQTIVNTIAAALDSGKKVLFVAEKTAALDVVRSRLEAWGLGPFVLPLLANRSSRKKVIDSIRGRINLTSGTDPYTLDKKIDDLKATRSEINEYLHVLPKSYGLTSLTVFEIIGKYILNYPTIEKLPKELKTTRIQNVANLTTERFRQIYDLCKRIDKAWGEALSKDNFWENILITNLTPFQIDEILFKTEKCINSYEEVIDLRTGLESHKLDPELDYYDLVALQSCINSIADLLSDSKLHLLPHLISKQSIDRLNTFLAKANLAQEKESQLLINLKPDFNRDTAKKLRELASLLTFTKIQSLSKENIKPFLIAKKNQILTIEESIGVLRGFIQSNKFTKSTLLSYIIKASDLIHRTQRDIIVGRNETFSDPTIKSLLNRYKSDADSLVERRSVLQQLFTLNTIKDVDKVNEYTKTISSAGFFSFFSGKYRKAKAYYRYINKHNKYKKAEAISELKALTEWLIDNLNFNSDQRLKKLLGESFDGIDTDFQSIQRIFEFFEKVNDELPGTSNKPLRNFLKYSDNDTIFTFPYLDECHPLRSLEEPTFQEAQNKVFTYKAEFDVHKKNIKRIFELAPIFNTTNLPTPEKLNSYANIVESFSSIVIEINDFKDIRELLGREYDGYKTQSDQYKATLQVAGKLLYLKLYLRDLVISIINNDQVALLRDLVDKIVVSEDKFVHLLHDLKELTGLDLNEFKSSVSQEEFLERVKEASKDTGGLIAYSKLYTHLDSFENTEFSFLSEFFNYSYENDILFSDLFEAAIYHAMTCEVYNDFAEVLNKYDGSTLEALRDRFSKLDKEIIRLNRIRLSVKLRKHSNPPPGIGRGLKKNDTELSLIQNEISKKRQYISSRSLTQRAGQALLELKPCWMMSPLAVAQYIPKGSIEFDLVIIDEASQMTPENSIGALVRSKQAMIVGDTNQLPPTTFFRKVFEDYENEDEEAVTNESVLEMANAVFRPARRLQWHYRSRHTSLIAFSNKYVYDNDLIIFPSAYNGHGKMGVSLVEVEGLYSSGTNSIEAKVMVDHIVSFMKEHPKRSLGVVVVNQRQRELLAQEFEYTLSTEPKCIKYIDRWENRINEGLESFFIKNLENVQGDERDVIFIGTVYGPETKGARVMQRFGPINGIAGKRRLNVLFTRAKEQIITFSSMTSSDISVQEGGNEGVYLLKKWLEYSGSGFLETGTDTGREPDSDFERHVIEVLNSIGCDPVPQVGVAGYFIDIGVKHANWPHGYLLGVECDGRSYHSSKSARDRDRLRQEVLEGLGWKLHRIWSTDWFEDPYREIEKLRNVIKHRITELTDSKTYNDIELGDGLVSEEPTGYDYEIPSEEDIDEPESEAFEERADIDDDGNEFVEVGDRVTFYFDEDFDDLKEITNSSRSNDPDNNIVLYTKPLAQALIEAEIDEQAVLTLNNMSRTVTVVGIKKKSGKSVGTFAEST